MLNLVWRASALDDLEAIFTYIVTRNRPAAERIHAAIEACAERLPDHPYMYRAGRIVSTSPLHSIVTRVPGAKAISLDSRTATLFLLLKASAG